MRATSQHFGLVGTGHFLVLDLSSAGRGGLAPAPLFSFPTPDALFGCAWSESRDSLCAAASGDGSVRLFNTAPPPAQNPVCHLHEHAREVHGIDWNPVRRDAFLSASWDNTLKLLSPDRPASVRTFRGHEYCMSSVDEMEGNWIKKMKRLGDFELPDFFSL